MATKKENPIIQLLLGIFIIGLGLYSYKLFGILSPGDNGFMSVVCEILGKYVVSFFLIIVGIKTLFAGIKGTINQDEEEEEEQDDYKEEITEYKEPFLHDEVSDYKANVNNANQNITVNLKDEEFGVKKTLNYKSEVVGGYIRTETHTQTVYKNYVSDVKNKELYFQTVVYLMRFIQEYEKSLDITTNKFYVLARENSNEIENLDLIDLEKKIFENAEKCEIEFNHTEINSMLTNSMSVLRGKLVINQNIANLYFKLFDVLKIRLINKDVYFYGLRD